MQGNEEKWKHKIRKSNNKELNMNYYINREIPADRVMRICVEMWEPVFLFILQFV